MAFGKKNTDEDKEKKKGGRFKTVSSNGAMPQYSVVVDSETGVNYLVVGIGMEGVSVTVMVNPDGKPIVTPLGE